MRHGQNRREWKMQKWKYREGVCLKECDTQTLLHSCYRPSLPHHKLPRLIVEQNSIARIHQRRVARRRAMTFRLDLCIIVQKNTVICCINCVALSFYTHFYSCIFHPCLFLLFRADISTPAFSTPAFSDIDRATRYCSCILLQLNDLPSAEHYRNCLFLFRKNCFATFHQLMAASYRRPCLRPYNSLRQRYAASKKHLLIQLQDSATWQTLHD